MIPARVEGMEWEGGKKVGEVGGKAVLGGCQGPGIVLVAAAEAGLVEGRDGTVRGGAELGRHQVRICTEDQGQDRAQTAHGFRWYSILNLLGARTATIVAWSSTD